MIARAMPTIQLWLGRTEERVERCTRARVIRRHKRDPGVDAGVLSRRSRNKTQDGEFPAARGTMEGLRYVCLLVCAFVVAQVEGMSKCTFVFEQKAYRAHRTQKPMK